jgi:hypothetical protein
MSTEPTLTPAAQHLAERWARAVEEGNWVHLHDEAGELSLIADELSTAAAAVTRDDVATDPLQLLAYIETIGERPTD